MKLIMSDKPLNIPIQHTDEIKHIDLSSLTIANCMGCFGCWTKTPGRCVIRDDATQVYPYMAQSNAVLYISRLKYGGYHYENDVRTGYSGSTGIYSDSPR